MNNTLKNEMGGVLGKLSCLDPAENPKAGFVIPQRSVEVMNTFYRARGRF